MEANLHDITNEKILEQSDNSISLEFVIPETSDFFDGHFPEFKLLPAVAQFEVITRFSRKYLGSQRYIPNIRRIKFSAPIRPNSKIKLDLTRNDAKETISFNMADADNAEHVYSSGSFNFIKEQGLNMAKQKALITNTTNVTAEFYDVDSMDVVWHGNYVKFMEVARCALLDKIGYGYKEMKKDGYAFPVTTLSIKYIRSLYFAQTATVKTELLEYENMLKIRYEIYNQEGALLTKAETTQMAVKFGTTEGEFITPERFRKLVESKIEN